MRVSVLVVSCLLVAACASTSDQGLGVAAEGPTRPAAAHCPDPSTIDLGFLGGAEDGQAPLPDGVAVTAVLSCTVEVRDIPGEGRWSVLVASWADTDLDGFTKALRRPDEAPSNGVCGLMAVMTPWFAVITADGEVIRPRVPVGACRNPQDAALEAFAALPFHTFEETRLKQNETPEAGRAGCSQQWKDMVAIMAADGSAKPAAEASVLGGSAPTKVRVCTYASDGAPADQTPVGDFRSGRALRGPALAAAFAGLEDAPAARTCTTRATTFAVLMPVGKDVLTVETDGCARMLTEAGELRQAPASLLAALR